jgi:hypothetical protein
MAGLTALRHALPVVVGVQRGYFGDEMNPDGSLLTTLLHLDTP